jgi:RNA:NAD 2'-phosphotransferase (TPT1/KptA family)
LLTYKKSISIVRLDIDISNIEKLYYDMNMSLDEIWTNETIPPSNITNITNIVTY